jgi:hypothetical protein
MPLPTLTAIHFKPLKIQKTFWVIPLSKHATTLFFSELGVIALDTLRSFYKMVFYEIVKCD